MRLFHVGILVASTVVTEYAVLHQYFRAVVTPGPAVFLASDFPDAVAQWPGLRSRGPSSPSYWDGTSSWSYGCRCPLRGKAPHDFPQCGAFDRQIARDLAPYQTVNMTSAVLDAAYNHTTANLPPSFHFSIRDNVIRYKARNEGSFKDALMAMLRKLQSAVELPDVEFVLNTWDHPKAPRQDKVPLLSPCSNAARSDIVFPYHYAYDGTMEAQSGNGFELGPVEREKCRSKRFEDRTPKAHWRGGCTGPEFGYTAPLYKYYTRARANLLTERHPDLIDAGLVWDCAAERPETTRVWRRPRRPPVESDGRRPAPLPLNQPEDWCDYRYYLLLDGNTVSGRSTWVIQMGFVLFKPASPFYEYWYTLLEPWVHYIPVEENLNDLPEKVRWANDHPERAKEIAENLSRLADVVSREETWMCYWWRLLRSLAALQNFESRVEGFPNEVGGALWDSVGTLPRRWR